MSVSPQSPVLLPPPSEPLPAPTPLDLYLVEESVTEAVSQAVLSPSRMQLILAIAALLIALASISLSAILVRYSERELSPYSTAFNRFWLTTAILGAWYAVKALYRKVAQWRAGTVLPEWLQGIQPEHSYSDRVACTHACETLGPPHERYLDTALELRQSPFNCDWVGWSLLALGGLLAADLVLWAWSLTQTSVASATLLANLTPLFTCFGGWLLWRKRFDRRLLLGLAIAVLGTVALGASDLQIGATKLLGDGVALLAALAFGLYLLVLERLQMRLGTAKILLGSSAIAALLTFPIVWMTDSAIVPTSWQGWLSILGLALMCQVIGQGLLTYCLNALSSEFVAIFLLMDPILAAVGGWVFFDETLTLIAWVAFAIVLVGIYLASSSKSALKEAAA
ncbi:MAG TPA: DMT family transporter [Stenomitos sp.]